MGGKRMQNLKQVGEEAIHQNRQMSSSLSSVGTGLFTG